MSTPLVWIGLPILIGLFLALFNRWSTFVTIASTCVAAGLAVAAWLMPSGDQIVIGSWSTPLTHRIGFGSLQLTLLPEDQSLMILLYSMTAFLMAGCLAVRSQRRLAPYGLVIIGLFVAALSIEPLHLGALIFPLAVFLSIIILAPPGSKIEKGLLRFLVFQMVGVAFILLTGWAFGEDVKLVADPPALTRALLIFGIGFALLFAIFPLYTWVIMIAQGCHPYAAVFVFLTLFGSYNLYFQSFLGRYSWLLVAVDILDVVRIAGVLMVATGGAWAAFQRNLGRTLGYAVVIEVGYSLLAIGLQDFSLYTAMLVPRVLTLAVWGLGLDFLKEHVDNLDFKTVQGMARQYPFTSAAILLAHFSLAGLPALASFPVLLAMWNRLASVSVILTIWCTLGSFGLIANGFRSLAVLVMGSAESTMEETETLAQRFYLVVGILGLWVVGTFPQLVYPWFINLAGAFGAISP